MNAAPFSDEITQHHLNLQAGSLKVQQCSACERRQWPPRPACPACADTEWEWMVAPPTGRLFSWTVVHRTPLPAFTERTPYAVGVFDIGDGLRIIGRIVGPPTSLVADSEFAWRIEDVAGEGPQAVWHPAGTDAAPVTSLLDEESYAWVGRSTVYPAYEVTTTDIAKFAHAIGARDPIHFDADAAQAAGHQGVVAPLAYLAAIRYAAANMVPLTELTRDGIAEDMVPPSRATRRMAGETDTRFHRPITAGDCITVTKTITDLTEKPGRSGPLVLITYALDYRSADGQAVADETFVRILR